MDCFINYIKEIEKSNKTEVATEHTYRPYLKVLIESIEQDIYAINEPKRVACGSPDYIIYKKSSPIGYIETKGFGKSLDEIEKTEQIKRYLDGLTNFVLTNYIEFRWYVLGEHKLTVRLAKVDKDGKLKYSKDDINALKELFLHFIGTSVPVISNSKELAYRMAAFARLIKKAILLNFGNEGEYNLSSLHQQLEGFRKILINDLTIEEFADMYAQTLCYGIFAAKCNHNEDQLFMRQTAAFSIPKTNPFLRKLFAYIAGPELDDSIVWVVDDLVETLNKARLESILGNFIEKDPIIHFYETFLEAYDPHIREIRGVYYTPEPVVNYIVNSVDNILRNSFNLKDGLADSSKANIIKPGQKNKSEIHRVQILDPAAGTGTFLFSIINKIYKHFKYNEGLWSSYVSEHLLPRVFGFEVLMAPYAVAHMKLGLLLSDLNYDFLDNERLHIYLTNTLEEPHAMTGLPMFTYWLAEEANSANEIKQQYPVMVILGNPPYSGHSANKGTWITNLLEGKDMYSNESSANYFSIDGKPINEKNTKWLNDDYVKFIRFSQWKIEQTGSGIIAFICNNGFLDNITFRAMRKSILDTFNDIYILNLHGDVKKNEVCIDGSKDENVFDIQQGVCIFIFVKKPRAKKSNVYYADLKGPRNKKYNFLDLNDISKTEWKKINPDEPHYLLVPEKTETKDEYYSGFCITEAMPINTVAVTTHRDNLAVGFTSNELKTKIERFIDEQYSDEEVRNTLFPSSKKEKFLPGDNSEWSLSKQRRVLQSDEVWEFKIQQYLYRPFDVRYILYHEGVVDRTRRKVMKNMCNGANVALITNRQIREENIRHSYVTNYITDLHVMQTAHASAYVFPLYLHDENNLLALSEEFDEKKPNFDTRFIREFESRIDMSYVYNNGNLVTTFGPKDIFNYIYAILQSRSYCERYSDFIKRDFPYIPFINNKELFRALCEYGNHIIEIHTLQNTPKPSITFPVKGSNLISKVIFELDESSPDVGKVWINDSQYFANVPVEAWEYYIGSYQVCSRWLKERKGRKLNYRELVYYQNIIGAANGSLKTICEIDNIIKVFGGLPIIK